MCNDGDWGLLESKEYLSSLVPHLSLRSSAITVSLAIRSPPNWAIQTKATSGTKEHLQILIVFLLCLLQHLFITLSFKPGSSNERNHTTTMTNHNDEQRNQANDRDFPHGYHMHLHGRRRYTWCLLQPCRSQVYMLRAVLAQSPFLAPFHFVIKLLSQDHALHFCWLGIQI